jgi:hypothetical protein
MARRNLKTIKYRGCKVTIAKDSFAGEYVVTTFVNGKKQGGKDGGYFTDDKKDARGTAAATLRRLRREKRC